MSTFTQDQRFGSFASPLGNDTLLLRGATATELVSGLSTVHASLESERDDIDAHEIVGKGAAVVIETADGSKRYFHGIVSRFLQGGRDTRLVEYKAELRPWLWLLTRRSNCRIFQNKTVPQIVEQVFRDSGCSDFEFKLDGTYDPRIYCVQYRETDFDFVSRLLEEVGIFYFVRHEADRHVVVLADSPAALPDCPGQAEVDYQGDVGQAGRDLVTAWESTQELHTGRVTLKDYNFEDPGNPLLVSRATGDKIGDNQRHEAYDYHPEKYPASGKGEPIARLRMQEGEAGGVRNQGQSTCRAFAAGHAFTLQKHFRDGLNGKRYLLLAVEHRLNQPSMFRSGTGTATTYENTFVCMPADVPFRPARVTPKPFVRGPQTAVVVGPAGEEIHVDKYGRIKVQFHWDREGKKDDQSSCWIRVSQAWAGKQWGALVHPRIGDEVVVECLEGDPDKPIVTGCVYNAQQMPPYDLPANKTQSGLKSRSSPGGSASNFNELRFEDKKGQEEVFFQAEKDKRVNVKHNRSETVGNDESISIGHDRSETVGHDETISIGNDRTETVAKNETITIGVDRTETVGANETIAIGANRTETVGANETITISANKTVSVAANHTESVGANQTINVAVMKMENVGAASLENVGAAKTLTVAAAYAVSVGAAMNVAVGGALMQEVGASSSTSVSGEASVKAKKIVLEADDEIEIKTGAAKITLKKSGEVAIEGTKIEIKGATMVDVKAAMIKLNS